MTKTVPDISPLMPMHQDPLLVGLLWGESTGHRWIPFTKAKELWWVFFIRLIKRSSKQSWSRWFRTPSRLLWRHCNGGLCGKVYMRLIIWTNVDLLPTWPPNFGDLKQNITKFSKMHLQMLSQNENPFYRDHHVNIYVFLCLICVPQDLTSWRY